MKKRNPPKPRPRRPAIDYRNVTRGARLLAEMIEDSQKRDERKEKKP